MMKVDPSTQRARSVVLLVILTIALPSILLTVIGAAAVGNEEMAARKRLERAYQPVVWDLSKKVGDDIDAILEKSAKPLEELVHMTPPGCEEEIIPEEAIAAMEHLVEVRGDNARMHVRPPRIDIEKIKRIARHARHQALVIARANTGGGEAPEEAVDHRELDAFVEGTPVAVNYFVIAPDGEVLIPSSEDGEDPTEPVPPALLAENIQECEDDADSCLAKYAKAKSAEELKEDCDEYAGTEVAAAGIAMNKAFHEKPRDTDKLLQTAHHIASLLSDPTKRVPAKLSELIARRTARQLETIPCATAERARYLLLTIAERPALLRYLAKLSHLRDTEPQVAAYGIEDWRRVVVARNVDGYTAGFELVPAAFEPSVNRALAERAPNEPVTAKIETLQRPTFLKQLSKSDVEQYDQKIANWVFLKRTDLAWRLVVQMTDEGALTGLMRSRSTLYFWALILMAGALLVGIGYTVRSVIREAQLARLKTDFVSSVSHDLRTPLTSIRMFTETLLLNRASSEQEAREFLRVIADETERLSRLTERILDFSRMEAGRKAYHFSSLDVRDLIQRSLAACRPMIEEAGFEVTVEIAKDVPAISADHDAMIEVLINLVSNAIKYSPDEKKIAIRATVQGNFVSISVSDRGIGIPKSEHRKIFEKFYRVECRRTCEVGGSGIGLSLVDHIISAHHGAVDVESKPGEGSTFTVRLAPGGVS